MNIESTIDLGSQMFKRTSIMDGSVVIESSRNITIHLPSFDDDLRIIEEDSEERFDKESITNFFSGNFVGYSFGEILSDTAGSGAMDTHYDCPPKTSRINFPRNK